MLNGVILDNNPDPRNYKISQFIPKKDVIKDTTFSLKLPMKEIIMNQGDYNACVGHSFALCKSILEYNQSNKWIEFDPFRIYGTRFPGEYDEEGMVPSQGAKALYKEGAVLRRDFNIRQEMPQIMDTVREWNANNPEKVKEALNFKITGYAYTNTIESVKTALKNGMPVSTCWPVYDTLYNAGSDGKVKLPNSSDSISGYHQMTIVGWTNTSWIVVNSWGTELGFRGVYLIPFEYKFESGISVSDTIIPAKKKATEITLSAGSNICIVDDETIELSNSVYIKNNRTYVPIEFISNALGCSIETKGSSTIIHSEEADVVLYIGKNSIKVNDNIYTMDVSPELIDSTIMIPVRFVSEYLNCSVDWNDNSRQIKIKSL